jgi:hypothetical protein
MEPPRKDRRDAAARDWPGDRIILYRPTVLGERMLRAWTTFARELAWEMKP